MDERTKLIQEILMRIQDKIVDTEQENVKSILHICLNEYEVQKRTTEVTIYDGSADGLLNRYIATKRIEGLSSKTLKRYYDLLHMMIHNIGCPLYEITPYTIRCYLAVYQQQRNTSNRTLDGMRKVFNGFFSWLQKEEILPKNPCYGVSSIKYKKNIKKPYTSPDMEKIKRSCTSLRDLALVEFLYSSGCRVSEIVQLNRSDVDFMNREVIVLGKGNKERRVYLTPIAIMYLQQYIESRTDADPCLFASLKVPHSRISKNGIEAALKRLGIKAGVENVHPHRYRRTLATNLLDRGANLQDVASILGHESVSTTQIYCYISQANVKAAYNKYAA